MADPVRITLDNPLLHTRLRHEFAQAEYCKNKAKHKKQIIKSKDNTLKIQTDTYKFTNETVDIYKQISIDNSVNVNSNEAIYTFDNQITDKLNIFDLDKNIIAKIPNPKVAFKTILGYIKRKNKKQLALITLAVMVMVMGIGASYIGWRDNRVVQVKAAELTKQANQTNENNNVSTPNSALSTVKPSTNAVANYNVASDLPRYLIIPKYGVKSRVMSVGVTNTGAMAVPKNIYDTAWFDQSAKPGQKGAMLINGHVSSWTANGVFYNIKKLVADDIIQIQRGDGTIFSYKVVKSQVFDANSVDMKSAVTPVIPGKQGLNLITCTGSVKPGTDEFDKRIVVYTVLQ